MHPRQLLVVALALLALPFAFDALGLPLRASIDAVALALAAMGLNVLVGYTGLVSFGHGAWFGMGAYAAALSQRHLFEGDILLPLLFVLGWTLLAALFLGALILRRRGVYFSLLTLALSAVLFTVAFRWTDFTGGENGLGGIVRPVLFGFDLSDDRIYYAFTALIAFAVIFLLWRFHRSPAGSVLVAIRENEQRARFLGYSSYRFALMGFVLSALVCGLAGALSVFNHRFASAEPISVIFSGELLAMVIIGGMRSFLGPAIGALFYLLFREFLSIYTPHWLFFFGILFVSFIMFSPEGLVGVVRRALAPFRKEPATDAAMSGRTIVDAPLPDFLRPGIHVDGPILDAQGLTKAFGGTVAVDNVDIVVADRSLHALIGPNGAGKTSAFNIVSGMFPPDRGTVSLAGREIAGMSPNRVADVGVGRSFQITNLFPSLTVRENLRLAVQARSARRYDPFANARSLQDVERQTDELVSYLGLSGIERVDAGALSYGGQRLLDMGLALATKPRILLLDEPLAGLAAAERERIGALIKTVSSDLPVLLVEHDIDRVFQIADRVTVMNEGRVLVDGTAEDARTSPEVQAVYIGSGVSSLAAKPRTSAAEPEPILKVENVDTFYGKSHILADVSMEVRRHEIVALLGRNGAGKSTLLKTLIGIAPPAAGRVQLAGEDVNGLPPAEIARRGVGYVPQGRALFSGMTVEHNLELGRLARHTGNGVRWDTERVLAYFPRLAERLHTPADALSGGEQQMVAVARALSGDTRVLLLDEPFEGLAPAIIEQLFETFDQLRREVSIVIVDHHLDLALALSDRTVALERGRVIHEGPSGALREDLDLRRQVLWL